MKKRNISNICYNIFMYGKNPALITSYMNTLKLSIKEAEQVKRELSDVYLKANTKNNWILNLIK